MFNAIDIESILTSPLFAVGVFILSIWSLIWKGFALWHSARKDHKPWFVIFLIVNTFGLLEIFYLALQRAKEKKGKKK